MSWLGGGAAILVFASFYLCGDRAAGRSILNVWWLPGSARVLHCESPFTTDMLVSCYIEIDPADFTGLLSGRAFVSGSTQGWIHEYPRRAALGEDFEIADSFAYDLRDETEFGGLVLVVADRQRHRAVVHLYIE
ncbi:MAG: hypothetical protein ACRDKE_13080, partial [Solirubrobacterales bacterium]